MTEDGKKVFYTIAGCEISSYTTMYPPQRVVISAGEIARTNGWTVYRVRKAVKGLVEEGVIERASCGNPAVESCGEYRELVYDAAPPTNGYAITRKGFQSMEWKDIYKKWCQSMEKWANG